MAPPKLTQRPVFAGTAVVVDAVGPIGSNNGIPWLASVFTRPGLWPRTVRHLAPGKQTIDPRLWVTWFRGGGAELEWGDSRSPSTHIPHTTPYGMTQEKKLQKDKTKQDRKGRGLAGERDLPDLVGCTVRPAGGESGGVRVSHYDL